MLNAEQFREKCRRVFGHNPDGKEILEYLSAHFYDSQVFVKGGQDGDRETCYKAGKRDLVGFIIQSTATREDTT
jgi:hypothetical protein